MNRRISDLTLAQFQAKYPPMIGGDPATTTEDAIGPRLRQVNEELTAAHQAVREARAEHSRVIGAISPEDAVNPASEGVRKAHEASRTLDEAIEKRDQLSMARDQLMDIGRPRGGDLQIQHDDRSRQLTVGDTMLQHLRESAGHIAAQSEGYQRLVQQRAFFQNQRKSIEEVLIGSGGEDGREHLIQAIQRGDRDFLANALVVGAGNLLVEPDRQAGITPLRTAPLRMVDLVTVGRTDSDEITYVEQNSFTNNAAEVAEATAVSGTSGTKPESGFGYVERTANVRTIAHWIPATKRALADIGQLRTLIEQVLQLGLDIRLDTQIAKGDGVGENIRGIYNTVGIGNVTRRTPSTTVNLGTVPETFLDVIHRAISTVRLAFHEPTAIGIHPSDFEKLRLMRATAGTVNAAGGAGTYGSGDYIMGEPLRGDGGITVWGLVPVVSAAFTEGLPVVGDFRQAVLWMREGTQVLASDSHMDFFIRNMVAILAEFRAGFGVLAPAAFCTATL